MTGLADHHNAINLAQGFSRLPHGNRRQKRSSLRPQAYLVFYAELAASYQRKREFMTKGLRRLGFEFLLPEGSYYILAGFRQLSALADVEFAKSMTTDCGVAVVPGSSFFSNPRKGMKMVRFSYSKKDSTLADAMAKLDAYFDHRLRRHVIIASASHASRDPRRPQPDAFHACRHDLTRWP